MFIFKKKKQVLVGFDDAAYLESFTNRLGLRHYNIFIGFSIEDILFRKMGLDIYDPEDSLPRNHFDFYIIDVNFRSSDSLTVEPALKIYKHLEDYIKSGNVKFLGLADRDELVKLAEKAGIPIVNKNNYDVVELVKKW